MYIVFFFLALLLLGLVPAHVGGVVPLVTLVAALAIGRALGLILEPFELVVIMAAVGASVACFLQSVPPVLLVG